MDNSPAHIISFSENKRIFDCQLYILDHKPPSGLDDLYDFYKIWQEAGNGKKMPTLHELTFEKLKGWHSSIRIVSYGKHIKSPISITIMGDLFAEYWGKGAMYDQIHSKNPPSQDTIDKYYQYLDYIYKHHYCVGCGVLPKSDGSLIEIKWLDLPISNDGKTVTHSIAALLPTG